MKYLNDQRKKINSQSLDEQTQKPGQNRTYTTAEQDRKVQTAQPAQKAAQPASTRQLGTQNAAQTGTAQSPAVQTAGNGQQVQPTGQSSSAVQSAQQMISQQLNGYQSRYGGQISDLLDQLNNREAFEYDINADPTYLALREQWIRDGNLAMQDTMAEAASLTGGYGNSYAQLAGQQAYQGYLQGLNEMVPDLKAAAMDEYDRETDALLQRYSLLSEQEENDYQRYLDDLDQLNYEKELAYQQSRDEIEDKRYEQEWAYQQEQDERSYAYELAMAAYSMGDDSLVKALGINPEEYASYSSGGSGAGSSSGGGSGGSSGETGTGQEYANVSQTSIYNLLKKANTAEKAQALAERMIDGGASEDEVWRTYLSIYENITGTDTSSGWPELVKKQLHTKD